jgi:hypothetical protein
MEPPIIEMNISLNVVQESIKLSQSFAMVAWWSYDKFSELWIIAEKLESDLEKFCEGWVIA